MLTEAWLRAGQRVFFVQVPFLRTGLERVLRRRHAGDEGHVVRPWPIWPACAWARIGEARLRRLVRRRAAGLRRVLERRLSWDEAVAIVVSPVWTPWLDALPFRHVVYDCIDELAVQVPHRNAEALYRKWEQELVGRASGAVVTALRLGDALRARRGGLPIAVIRNGVDAARFQSLAAAAPRPADLPPADAPVVGFVGALYEWVDWELIRETAERLPEYRFVFVGPHDRRGAVGRIASLPNVRLLGPRPYERVPAYVNAFDACWVPFRQNEVGAAANPVKIYEYLALGKPVVTTPVADTDSFRGLVALARTADEMAACLRATGRVVHGAAAARAAFAQENSWAARAGEYVRFLRTLEAEC